MKIKLIPKWGGLEPFDDEAIAVISKWKDGDMIVAEVVRPRNGKFHKKFFAMLNIIYMNSDEFKSITDLLNYVKIETGHADIIEVHGVAFRVPKTISFAQMDEDSFSVFYNSAVQVCVNVVPMDEDLLANKVAAF